MHDGGLGFGAAQLAQHTRAHDARQQREDGQHHQQLDQGKALAAAARGGRLAETDEAIHDAFFRR